MHVIDVMAMKAMDIRIAMEVIMFVLAVVGIVIEEMDSVIMTKVIMVVFDMMAMWIDTGVATKVITYWEWK